MKAVIAAVVIALLVVTCCYKFADREKQATDNLTAYTEMLKGNPTAAGKGGK